MIDYNKRLKQLTDNLNEIEGNSAESAEEVKRKHFKTKNTTNKYSSNQGKTLLLAHNCKKRLAASYLRFACSFAQNQHAVYQPFNLNYKQANTTNVTKGAAIFASKERIHG